MSTQTKLPSHRSAKLEPGTSARVADASARGRRAGSREYRLFLLATGLVGLHIADDNYLQPEPGTSAGDHLASGLVPLGILAAVAYLYPRLRAGARAYTSMTLGALAVIVGVPGIYNIAKGVGSGDDPRAARHRRRGRSPGRGAGDPLAASRIRPDPAPHGSPALPVGRRRRPDRARDALARPRPCRIRVCVHASRTDEDESPAGRPGRARHGHDRGLARACRDLRAVDEPSCRDRLPGRDPRRRGAHDRATRIRRAAARAARARIERGRRRPLGGRPRPACGRRVRAVSRRCRRRADRRDRILDRRRDPHRGRCPDRGHPRGRLRGRRVPAGKRTATGSPPRNDCSTRRGWP